MGLKISDLPASAAANHAVQFEVNNAGTSERLTLAQMFALSTGAVVANTPLLDMAQTWNNAAVAFTGWQLNVTNAASAVASMLLDLQVGGVRKFSVSPSSVVYVNALNGASGPFSSVHVCASDQGTSPVVSLGGNSAGVSIRSDAAFAFSSEDWTSDFGFRDTFLVRDAANTLAQRNGANAQRFNLYSTYTDASNYSRLSITANGNEFQFACANAGTGPARDLSFVAGAGRAIYFGTDATAYRLFISNAGHLLFGTDNSFDIGANGANRPRNLYVAGIAIFGNTVFAPLFNSNSFGNAGNGWIIMEADGVFSLRNNAGTGFSRLQFGGTSAGFPSLKRNADELHARLADDSDFAKLRGQLMTHAAAVAETITPDKTLTLYDANGTAYKVPCVAA